MSDRIPHVRDKDNHGRWVQAQRVTAQIPKLLANPGGSGVQSHALHAHDATRAPFPWYGGKRRWAASIWSKLGEPGVYAEPFAGSLAVLLHRRQPCAREIVCDTDGLLCNFWRALRADPEAVAYWAAWPTIHQDLTARHTWLRDWRAEHGGEVERDPDFYDVKVAGWWVWGLSNWIGGGWCSDFNDGEPRPHVNMVGGQGVQAQRGPRDKLPKLQPHTAASACRRSGELAGKSRKLSQVALAAVLTRAGPAPVTSSTARAGRHGLPRWPSAWSAWSC